MRTPALNLLDHRHSPSVPLLLAATVFFLGAARPAKAQGGLEELPDTEVSAQLEAFQAWEGASVNLFAREPIVANPIHMNWDARGRLWVVGSALYPQIEPGEEEKDRLVVLEDTDGDGVADEQTVFADDLHIPTAVLPGDGGVYVANATQVLFLRDTDGDDRADERRVVLSGFGTEDTHHLVHTFRWGPEGMMWMNQSIYIHTHLETPHGVRRLLGGGMWHYRPETRRAEVFMKGLINPWGHAFDEWGQSFLTDGAGSEGINFVFPRAVFRSSPGASRVVSGLNPGQPKHCGVEVLTGRHLPEELRGLLAAPDFRGHRINLFDLQEDGSSAYTSTQQEDLVASTHRAFRPVDIKMGPDGAIYVADWYNPIIQHGEVDFRDPRRDHRHGRIWRISFDDRDPVETPNLAEAPAPDLVAALHSPEGLTRELTTAELRTRDPETVLAALEETEAPDRVDPDLAALRRVWATQAVNRFDQKAAAALLDSEDHRVRAGALRAIYYTAASNDDALSLARRAVSDPHPRVRLWGVSVLAQLDSPDTVPIALKALEGVEVDDYLDFAVWSICREHSERWTDRATDGAPFANVRQLLFAVRALNEPVAVERILGALADGRLDSDGEIADVADWIANVGDAGALDALFAHALKEDTPPGQRRLVLDALLDAAKLRKKKPAGDLGRLSRFLRSDHPGVFASAAALAGRWKLESARPGLQEAFLAAGENASRARAALDGLVALGGPKTAGLFDELARRSSASFRLRSLAVIGRTRMNPRAGAKLAPAVLRDAPDGEDPHGIFDAFLANERGPGALAAALKQESLPREIALLGMRRAGGSANRAEDLVGALREAGELEPMKTALAPEEMDAMVVEVKENGDPHRGESIYRRAALQCTVCHAIGGVGGVIGPDLVSIGSSAPVDYLIESMLQPSKKIKEGYHTTLVTLENGDSYAGAIASETDTELVIRDATGQKHRLPKSDVVSNEISPVSLMPPGLTASLREDEFVDLIAFLSKLGKEGDFKTPPNRYLREWQTLQPHERTRDAIGHYGPRIFAEKIESYQWTPFYAEVAGGLPVEEMPKVVGRGRTRYGVARTYVDVSSKTDLRLRVEGPLPVLDLLHGEEPVELPESGESAEVVIPIEKTGRHELTVVARHGASSDAVSVELLTDAGAAEAVPVADF